MKNFEAKSVNLYSSLSGIHFKTGYQLCMHIAAVAAMALKLTYC